MQSNRMPVRAVIATTAIVLAGIAVGAPSLASPHAASFLAPASADNSQASVSSVSVAAGSTAGSITVQVPRVAFGPDLAVSGGRLRAPVLLADPTVTGTASVVGADPSLGCAVPLVQGIVNVIDCSLPAGSRGSQTVAVTLSDGWQLMVVVP